MVGCAGSTTFSTRAALCAPGYRMATAQEWLNSRGAVVPTHNYWTDDESRYNGSANSCYVDFTGAPCPSGEPMRVCSATRSDPEGNSCTWGNCGANAAAPNEYFGGCFSNGTAGALCVPAVHAASTCANIPV